MFAGSSVAAVRAGALSGEMAAPAKRSPNESKLWSTRECSPKDVRGLVEAGGSDSSTANSEPTPVSKLAKRMPELFGS
jgi:hypothetical protein